MPVCRNADHCSSHRRSSPRSTAEFREGCLRIGLVNNMPDAALEATERQFLSLLDAASGGISVRLSLYALPEVPRSEPARCRMKGLYSGVETLWDTRLDGLIVTGAEPLAPSLIDETYWQSLTRVL